MNKNTRYTPLFFQKLLREPYFHFLFIGIVLYLFYHVSNPEENTSRKINIIISTPDRKKIQKTFHQQWKRDAHPEELNLMMKKHYDDEILLDQAIKLELPKEDKEIRIRLIEQMKHILTASNTQKEPTEKILYNYYLKHISDYSETKTLTFSHIYFKENIHTTLSETIEQFNRYNVKPTDAAQFGDKFTVPHQFVLQDFTTISKIFGKYFTKQLWKIKKGAWYGPIHSKEGMHAVFIIQKKTGHPLPFDEIEGELYIDYLKEQKEHTLKEAYKKLSTQYQLQIEP